MTLNYKNNKIMETNIIKEFFKRNSVRYGLIFIGGLLIGWLVFSTNHKDSAKGHDDAAHADSLHSNKDGIKYWTCSMHPQIKMDKEGKCPICGMDLIPVKSMDAGSQAVDANAIQLSAEAIALANIETTVVSRQNPVKNIHLYGTVQADERLLQSQVSYFNGRIEKLYINFTGETVRQGQTIAAIYSPDLLNAQRELQEAAKYKSTQPALWQAVHEKLRLLKLTDSQISAMEHSTNTSPVIDIKANVSGVVVGKRVNQGDYIGQGSVLFDVANLSRVWVVFDAYEEDLPFLKVGDKLDYTLKSIPGKSFSGKVSFISPILDQATRTAKVRLEASNPGMQLKPEMYADALVKASLNQHRNEVVVPKSAVLWTGKRSVVYVKQPNQSMPTFSMRTIVLGPSLGDFYVVASGLNDGEEVVTNGVFAIDASAQLEGKQSMMNGPANASATATDEKSAESKHVMIAVKGNCGMCKERIEKAAKGTNGVLTANWDQSTKMLHVDFNPSLTSIDAISKSEAKVGHDTNKYKADKKTYDALPECCKYRE
jgi:Cu(I)/Ag(I) efflux system membrane fusion protein